MQYYDIRKKCEGDLCYDFSNMEDFLNLKSVREALGVGDIDFVSCSSTVYEAMITDWMRNLEVGIPTLLEDGIKLLVYAGEYDLICNWLGNNFFRPSTNLECIKAEPMHINLLDCNRKLEMGSCNGMVWTEGFCGSSHYSIFSR